MWEGERKHSCFSLRPPFSPPPPSHPHSGQIELYTHIPVMRQIVNQLQRWDFRLCGVFLLDSQFLVEPSKFFSGVMTALSSMITLELPHVNVLSKMDLLDKASRKEVEKSVH